MVPEYIFCPILFRIHNSDIVLRVYCISQVYILHIGCTILTFWTLVTKIFTVFWCPIIFPWCLPTSLSSCTALTTIWAVCMAERPSSRTNMMLPRGVRDIRLPSSQPRTSWYTAGSASQSDQTRSSRPRGSAATRGTVNGLRNKEKHCWGSFIWRIRI